ncbi:hypothetical protein ACOMHN_020506 [Nucella lapillus]
MESIEQPIFNPYGSDDKDDLIVDPPSQRSGPQSASPTSENDASPAHSAKGLLNAGKQAMSQQNRGLWIIIISTIVFAIIVTIALILTIYLLPRQISGHAAVVTEVEECSEVGLEMLKMGGNAVDAAVAAAFCLSVFHPQSSGIGGGGFLLFHDHKNDKSAAYNFRETAPHAAFATMLNGKTNKETSGLSVGVPGELKGLANVHSEWGTLDWDTLIQPAINYARDGFNVTKNLADTFRHHLILKHLPGGPTNGLLKHYTRGGHFVRAGDFIARPDLARTLEKIRDEGTRAFYEGSLGENFVHTVRKAGGVMTMDDLKTYTVLKSKPVVTTFKDHTVLGMPAPSSGPVVGLMLNMLEGFNWTEKSSALPLTYQQMIETFKFGFGHRSLLGDPANEKYKADIENATTLLLSESLATTLRDKVDNTSHDASYYGPSIAASPNMGTTHLSIIDSTEIMVSLTLTINLWFGSKLMTPDGILANNEMLDFSFSDNAGSLPVNPRNKIVPGMRPLSSMVPTIVFNKERPCATRIVTGASNGTRIITGVVETLANSFLFGMKMKKAVSAPRIHQQLYPNDNTFYEDVVSSGAPNGTDVFPADIVRALAASQSMVAVSEGLSCVSAISKLNDAVEAYADWRKGGHAATY